MIRLPVLACLAALSSTSRTSLSRRSSTNPTPTKLGLKQAGLEGLARLLLVVNDVGGNRFAPMSLNRLADHPRAHQSDVFMHTDASSHSSIGRRALMGGVATGVALPFVAEAANMPEEMRTSESYTNLQQLSPETVGTLGAGTIASRSRPATGIVLLEDPQTSGKEDAPFVQGELILDGGVAANVGFQAEKGYPLARGMYYDIEVRKKTPSASVLLNVIPLPEGKTINDVKSEYITSKVFASSGRFGAYGPPSIVKVAKSKDANPLFDITFVTVSPSQREATQRALISVVQPEGSRDAVAMVATASQASFDKEEAAFRKMLASLRISKIRPTKLERKAKNDFRFEERGGLSIKGSESSNDVF